MREEGEKRRGLRVKNKRKRKRQWPRFSNSYSLTRVALVDEGLHRRIDTTFPSIKQAQCLP